MSVSRLRCAVVTLGLTVAAAVPSLAGEPTEQIRQTTAEVLTIVQDRDLKAPARAEERARRIREVTDERFAWSEMARRALGLHWRTRTKKQRADFVSLFRDLIEKTYLADVETQSREKIRYEGETIDGRFAVVKVTVVTDKDVEVLVEYRLFKREARAERRPAARPTTRPVATWLIYDMSAEGVSLVNNYRTQIRDIMARSSYEELVTKIKAKIAEKTTAASQGPASRPSGGGPRSRPSGGRPGGQGGGGS